MYNRQIDIYVRYKLGIDKKRKSKKRKTGMFLFLIKFSWCFHNDTIKDLMSLFYNS